MENITNLQKNGKISKLHGFLMFKISFKKFLLLFTLAVAILVIILLEYYFIFKYFLSTPDTDIHGQANQEIIKKILAGENSVTRICSWDTDRGRIYGKKYVGPEGVGINKCSMVFGDTSTTYYNAKGYEIATCSNSNNSHKECNWLESVSKQDPDYCDHECENS